MGRATDGEHIHVSPELTVSDHINGVNDEITPRDSKDTGPLPNHLMASPPVRDGIVSAGSGATTLCRNFMG